jgi:hypothetical protein
MVIDLQYSMFNNIATREQIPLQSFRNELFRHDQLDRGHEESSVANWEWQ